MKDLKRKVIVLGGEGFIGKNIIEELCDDYFCYSIGLEETFLWGQGGVFVKSNPYTEKINNDGDIYIHLIDNQVEIDDFCSKEASLMNNLDLKEGSHLILFSSAVVYADPESDYAKRKILLEEFYNSFCLKKGIKLTIFRLFNVYGSYQLPYRKGSLVANVFYNYLCKEPLKLSDLSVKRDFVYVLDVAVCVRYCIENKLFGLFDLGTGKPVSIGELIDLIERQVVRDSIDFVVESNQQELFSPYANKGILERIKFTKIDIALKQTYRFYNDNLAVIKKYLNEKK